MEVDKVLHVGQLVEVRDRAHDSCTPARLAAVGPRTVSLAQVVRPEAVTWKAGDKLELRLLTDQGVYSFETVVTELDADRLVVRKPGRLDRTQRREYLRIPEALAVRFSYQSSPLDAVRDVRCTTVDISAGGLRLKPQTPMVRVPKVGLNAEITLTLDPGEPPIRARCKVVRVQTEGPEVSIQFSFIQDKERARITRFVNARHVELQKKK